MVQIVLVILIFSFALIYLVWMIWKQFAGKRDCSGGCSCSGADLHEIEKRLKNNPIFRKS